MLLSVVKNHPRLLEQNNEPSLYIFLFCILYFVLNISFSQCCRQKENKLKEYAIFLFKIIMTEKKVPFVIPPEHVRRKQNRFNHVFLVEKFS